MQTQLVKQTILKEYLNIESRNTRITKNTINSITRSIMKTIKTRSRRRERNTKSETNQKSLSKRAFMAGHLIHVYVGNK